MRQRRFLCAMTSVGLLVLGYGCRSKEAEPAAPQEVPVQQEPPAEQIPAGQPVPQGLTDIGRLTPSAQTWTPEEMEALLAPIALYPDPVMTQVLMSATNPQEVLDAGNWLIANPDLEGAALDEGAEAAGFTEPVRAIMQFRAIVDHMCLEMGWTTELGQAFTNDQTGVLDAVQRLRKQAESVGNLQTSEQMIVESSVEQGKETIVTKPPNQEVVYVPTYDPQAAYAPPPDSSATTTTTQAQTESEKKGHSTGAMVATGVLSFGVGLTIGILAGRNRNYYSYPYYYPQYPYGRMPRYPPYHYHPVYPRGRGPYTHYRPPTSYHQRLTRNNVVVINNNYRNNNYWKSYNQRGPRTQPLRSPISQARPARPELRQLNAEAQARQRRQAAYRANTPGPGGPKPGVAGPGPKPGPKPGVAGPGPKKPGPKPGVAGPSPKPGPQPAPKATTQSPRQRAEPTKRNGSAGPDRSRQTHPSSRGAGDAGDLRLRR